MDVDALTDEVVRRLMDRIRQEQAADGLSGRDAGKEEADCCCTAQLEKQVITQIEAAQFAPGSKVAFCKGTIITPLAWDTLHERGVDVRIE